MSLINFDKVIAKIEWSALVAEVERLLEAKAQGIIDDDDARASAKAWLDEHIQGKGLGEVVSDLLIGVIVDSVWKAGAEFLANRAADELARREASGS